MERTLRLVSALAVLAALIIGPAALAAPGGAAPHASPSPPIERHGPDGETVMLLGSPYLSEPSTAGPEDVALGFVRTERRRFELTDRQVGQLVVSTSYRTAHNGAAHVVLGQEIGGRRVAGTGLTFAIDAAGRIVSAGGHLARGAAAGAAALDAATAIRRAGAAAGIDIPGTLPAAPARGRQQRFENVFAHGVKDPAPVTAELVWYPAGNGRTLHLAWETDFDVDADTWLVSYVDARDGRVLHQENRYVEAGPEGTVFSGQHPDDSGPRSVVPFSGIDGTWVADRLTSGNNANAYRDLDNDNAADADRPETPPSGDPGYQHFTYPWTDAWRTAADGSDASLDADLDAVVTQLFYYTNVMHDWLYGYGFDEASGNFQVDNFGRGGSGGDPVLAEAQDGWDFGCLANDGVTAIRCRNNAFFATPADGSSPRMQMYMWSPSRPYRDGSMDGDVIAHEYGHGVSSRLVGGGNLGYGDHLVHASLGEGWSDIISFLKWEDETVGEYVTGNAATGIRSVAYDTSTLTYTDYDPGAISGHPNGEIWASMVYDIREELGISETTQLVIDGMKATPDHPEFMDARDGIIAADILTNGGANVCRLWRIFADRGLGENATFSQASMSPPADNTDIPAACVPSADAGGPYSTPEGTDVTLDGSGSTEATDPSGGALVSYEWDLDNNGDFDDATGVAPTFTAVGDDGVFPIGLRVTNAAGVSDEATSTVTVTNVAPSVDLDAVASTTENTSITLTGTVSDPGWLDTLSATVDWDDGTGTHALAGSLENDRPDAVLSFSVDHTYGDDGVYTVEVCGADDDGGSGCDTVAVTITNTDPTATLGDDTYIAHAGEAVPVTADSEDPGSDDLDATFAWGDSLTDVVSSLVNPPALDPPRSPSIQPRGVDWAADHTYADACLYTLTLTVADDDGGDAVDTAAVVITGNDENVWGSGWWMNQYRPKPPNDFTTERLECYLDIVTYLSDVFTEARSPLDLRADAVDVLFVNRNDGTDEELFDEQLLGAWLNFANGAFDLDTLVDTTGDGVTDMTFEAAVTAAEAVRLDPAATRAQLLAQKDILERMIEG